MSSTIAKDPEGIGQFPRRLLHVPTSTSLEWRPGHYYGKWHEPRYAVISYTWGRFRLDTNNTNNDHSHTAVKGISVHGIPWSIPPISPSHFTEKEFWGIIRAAAALSDKKKDKKPVDFVWLDVACIDQRPGSPEGRLEIGRQAAIFTGAVHMVVWLNNLSYTSLSGSLNVLWDCRKELRKLTSSKGHEHGGRTSLAHTMTKLNTSLHTLLDSPWFSSLWTLQEAFIGGDSSLLASREGTIQDVTHALLKIGDAFEDILTHCACLRFEEEASKDDRDVEDMLHSLITECCTAIRKSGMVELSALHVIALYLAAKHRTASQEEDYIYGIQQSFEVRLGNTAEGSDPSRTFNRDDLELQLAAEMFKVCPVESQMHVYAAPVAPGFGFYPRMSSELPAWIPNVFDSRQMMYVFESECQLSILNVGKMTLGHFRGLQIPFRSLYQEWERINTARGLTPTSLSGSSVKSVFYFGIDGTGSSASPAFCLPEHVDSNQAMILFLGRAWLDLSNTREEAEEFGVGILSLRGKEEYGSLTFFHRLGFCLWKVRSEQHGRVVPPRNVLNPSVNENGWGACETCFG